MCNNERVTSDLRARRRRATEREIHTATLRLVVEHGLDQVTIDMISAEAGVSRRTFFNYFPSKEAALVGGPRELPADALAEFFVGTSTDPVQVLREVTRLLVREIEQNAPDREDLWRVFALTRDHPTVLALLLANFDAFGREVAAALAHRLGQCPDDELPSLLTAIALSAIRTGLQRWSYDDQRTESSPIPQVERTVALLHTLFAP